MEGVLLSREFAPPIDSTPLLPAEFLDLALIKSSMDHFGRRKALRPKLHSAWNHVEYALNDQAQISDDLRRIYLEYAQDLLGEIVGRHRAERQLHLDAFILSSYMPVFQKRSCNDMITNDDCQAIYSSLGRVVSYLQPPTSARHLGPRMEELMVLAISARISRPQFLLFPASPREESSSNPSWNHDSYFYEARTKRPVQQKRIPTEKQYDEQITRLILQPILDRAIKRKDEGIADTVDDQI